MFSSLQKTSSNAGGQHPKPTAIPRNDGLALREILQTYVRMKQYGLGHLDSISEEDFAFLELHERRVSSAGVTGSLLGIGGVTAYYGFKKLRGKPLPGLSMLPIYLTLSVIGSAVGRYSAVSDMLAQALLLPPESKIRHVTKDILLHRAQKEGVLYHTVIRVAGGDNFDASHASKEESFDDFRRQQQQDEAQSQDVFDSSSNSGGLGGHDFDPQDYFGGDGNTSQQEKKQTHQEQDQFQDFSSTTSAAIFSQPSIFGEDDQNKDIRTPSSAQPSPSARDYYDGEDDIARFANVPKRSWEEIRAEAHHHQQG